MKNIFLILVAIIYSSGLLYLALPDPKIAPLPQSLRSDEPGDTWQHPEQSAYYTDLNRQQITDFYQKSFSLKFGQITLPSYRLNYPPEETGVYVREQLLSYYLEEIIHPLRESLFVSGWNPRLSPISNYRFDLEKARWEIIVNNKEYQGKITLKPYFSPLWIRFFIWTSIFPLTYLVLSQFTNSTRKLFLTLKSKS